MSEIVLVVFAEVPLKLVPHHPERNESKRGGQQSVSIVEVKRRGWSTKTHHKSENIKQQYMSWSSSAFLVTAPSLIIPAT